METGKREFNLVSNLGKVKGIIESLVKGGEVRVKMRESEMGDSKGWSNFVADD